MEIRREHDLLGEARVPAGAYWGIHTLRALENFPITGKPIGSYPDLVRALALIKHAAALANLELGQLDHERADAIIAACQEIARGRLHEEFVVDVIQGGAAPELIEWHTDTHPAPRLDDMGLALERLEIHHPEPARIEQLLRALKIDGPIEVVKEPAAARLVAHIQTRHGLRTL